MKNLNIRLPEGFDSTLKIARELAKRDKRSLTNWLLIAIEEKIERDGVNKIRNQETKPQQDDSSKN